MRSEASKRGRSSDNSPVPPTLQASLREHRSRSNPLRGTARGSDDPMGTANFLESCGVVFPEEENVFWATERPAVTFSMELPISVHTRQGKEWVRDMGCFFVKQLRKQAIEISERQLTPKELEGFRHAKSKEMKNFIIAKAFQALPSHLKPTRSQILTMPWLSIWKLDDNPGPDEPLKKDASGNRIR